MVYTEDSSTVLDARFLIINGADPESGFPLDAPDGSVAAPSYAFERNSGTGMCLVADNLTFGAAGAASLGVSIEGNVATGGGAPTNYGVTTPGEGVLFIHDASTEPVGVPGGGIGGILYVSGSELKYLNRAGVVYTLTSKTAGNVFGPASSTTTAAVLFDGVTGKLIKDSGVLITPSSTLTTPDALLSQLAYTFAGDSNTGLYLDTILRIVTGGTTRIAISSTLVDFPTGVVTTPDGAAGAPAYAFSASPNTGMFLSGAELSVRDRKSVV